MLIIGSDLTKLCFDRLGKRYGWLLGLVLPEWLELAQEWPDWRLAGQATVLESVGRYRWAETMGFRWTPEEIMMAAARIGSVDVIAAIGPMFTRWPQHLLRVAGSADQLELVKVLAQGVQLKDPMLRAAGPRVRAWAELQGLTCFFDRTCDFRNILADARPVDPALYNRGPETYVALIHQAGGDFATIQLRQTASVRICGQGHIHLPRMYSMIRDVRVTTPGARILNVSINGRVLLPDPDRVFFTHGLAFATIDFCVCAPPLSDELLASYPLTDIEIEFTAVIASATTLAPYCGGGIIPDTEDGSISYRDGIAGQSFQGWNEDPLTRVDGLPTWPLCPQTPPIPATACGVPVFPIPVSSGLLLATGHFCSSMLDGISNDQLAMYASSIMYPPWQPQRGAIVVSPAPIPVEDGIVEMTTIGDFFTDVSPVGPATYCRVYFEGKPVAFPLEVRGPLMVETDATAVLGYVGYLQK